MEIILRGEKAKEPRSQEPGSEAKTDRRPTSKVSTGKKAPRQIITSNVRTVVLHSQIHAVLDFSSASGVGSPESGPQTASKLLA